MGCVVAVLDDRCFHCGCAGNPGSLLPSTAQKPKPCGSVQAHVITTAPSAPRPPHLDRRRRQVQVGHHQLLALGQLALMVLAVRAEQLRRHLRRRRNPGQAGAGGPGFGLGVCPMAGRGPARCDATVAQLQLHLPTAGALCNKTAAVVCCPLTANLRKASPSVSNRSRSVPPSALRAVTAAATSSSGGALRARQAAGKGAGQPREKWSAGSWLPAADVDPAVTLQGSAQQPALQRLKAAAAAAGAAHCSGGRSAGSS